MKLKLLGLLLVFAGVLYWQDSTSDDAMDKYIEEYKQFQAKADGTRVFTVVLQVKNTCVACAVLGTAKVKISFDKDGKFISTKLDSFVKAPADSSDVGKK